jgi:hypothetical protein
MIRTSGLRPMRAEHRRGAMTTQPQTASTIESIVVDLWRSFFETAFDALRQAFRQPRPPRLSATH